MIQQISMAQAQPAPHPQQTQPKPETDSFQTQMQKAVGERNKAKEDQSSPVPGKAKDEKTAPANTQADQTQALPVAAYLAQPILPQAELQQVNVSVVAPTVSGIDTSALQGTAQAVAPPQQQTIVSTNAEPAETIPAFRQETSQTNPVAPTDTLPAEKEASAFLANTQAETAQVTANPDSVITADIPLSTMPKQQNPSVQQPQTIGEKTAVQPAGETIPVQAQDSGNSVDLQSQENPVLAQKPNSDSETAVDVAQAPASFSELLGTGNVVIKISDTPASTEKTAPRQLADQISMKYKEGSPEFEMELFPKDLGKVTVKLAIEKGTMTVEILAANPKTQNMLLSSTGEIRSLIESTVHQNVQVQMPAQERQWYQQNQEQSQARQQQQEQQKEQAKQYRMDQDENSSLNDFVSVMQQLRVKTYSL